MSRYIESFFINGAKYSIEDYEDGQPMEEHFFGMRYGSGKTGDCKRFRLWRNGGGFGQADTLQEARQLLLDYATQNLKAEEASAKRKYVTASACLGTLGTDTAHLFRFEVKDE